MSKPEDTLKIDWNCQLPPQEAKSWHSWPTRSLPPDPLELGLSWPKGSLSVLEAGFQQGLHRFTGWELGSIVDPEPYLQAAKVFKRGVLTSLDQQKTVQGSYPLRLEALSSQLPELLRTKRCLIDAKLAHCWGLSDLPGAFCLEISETTKTLESVAKLLTAIAQDPPDQIYTIVGGGVFCDTAAFAVGLVNKRFELVPTTLLAMVDACVGGKTGVNFPPYGKNQLGLFLFPEQVLAWPGWLKTLDERQIRAGIAEAYKHALLSGRSDLLSLFQTKVTLELLEPHLLELIRIKAEVVSQDPGETGLRATLNLGHTLAHALEALSHKRSQEIILHGEAVSLGLAFQAILSHRLGFLAQAIKDEIIFSLKASNCLISRQELALYLGNAHVDDPHIIQLILAGIKQDKKNKSDDCSEWILLEDYGKTVRSQAGDFTVSVKDQSIQECYAELLKQLD